MSKIELLAPAGDKLSFIGAINAGANAIYLAGKSFGARKYANNFTNDELVELFQYAHLRNVLVFVTVNTIIYEDEINDLYKYTDFLVRNHIDALIVQDIGIIEQLVKRYPNTEIHASTQLNAYNINQIKYLESIGVKRVILARETSIDDIKRIKEVSNMDLEVFIHGALCVSYSGNCLFSYFNGGRSGNRGECAQPCRLKYALYKENELVNESGYLLSTKDLMTLNKLEDIINSGVISLKIEGRMRSPEYVTATVRAYKEKLDNKIEDVNKRINELMTVFNRDYTKGYILNENPSDINNSFRPNHQGIEVGKVIGFNKGKVKIKLSSPLNKGDGIRYISNKDIGGKVDRIIKDNNIVDIAYKNDIIFLDSKVKIDNGSTVRKTQSKPLNDELSKYLKENYKLVPLNITLEAYINKPLTLTINNIIVISDYIIPKADNPNQSKEKLSKQINKLGNTHYYIEELIINTDELGFIPNSVLNNLRRETLKQFEDSLLNKEDRVIKPVITTNLSKSEVDDGLIIKVETHDQLKVCEELGIKNIYITENLHKDDKYPVLMNRINDSLKDYKELVVNDYGLVKDGVITNSHLNVINSKSVETLLDKGVKVITLSLESTIKNTSNIIKNFRTKHKYNPPLEVIIYDRPDLMITKYCPVTKGMDINKENCKLCFKNQYYLQDDKANKYPLIKDNNCNMRVLHHKTIKHDNDIKRYQELGINRFRINLTIESYNETKKLIKKYKQLV